MKIAASSSIFTLCVVEGQDFDIAQKRGFLLRPAYTRTYVEEESYFPTQCPTNDPKSVP